MKRKLIQSFIILSASTAITKIFSIINKMILSRLISSEAMSLFILVIPSLSLAITLGHLGIPSAIFRLVANPKYNNKKVIVTSVILSIISCLTLIIGIIICSPYISYNLLNNPNSYYPILSLVVFIPVVAISGILKNYFLAKENVYLIAKAQVLEEIGRLIFSYLMIKYILPQNDIIQVTFIFLAMSFGEIISIIYMFMRLKQKTNFSFKYFSQFKENFILKPILSIALPVTGIQLMHTIVHFLEPIVLFFVLSTSLTQSKIQSEYAIISGFVISILMTPTFFNTIVYRIFLPIITRDLIQGKLKTIHQHLMIAILASLGIALPFSLIFYFYGDYCLLLLYNTTNGTKELAYLAFPFMLVYIQTPLSAVLQALNKNKTLFFIGFMECLLEFSMTYFLAPIYGVKIIAISLLAGLFFSVFISAILVFYEIYIKKV